MPDPSAPPQSTAPTPHVLVVDDDARLRALLSRYLAENGFRVTAADHAADARDKLRFLQPDLMVLDVSMPGETGLSLTQSLRAQSMRTQPGGTHPPGTTGPRPHTTPILLLTARREPEDAIAGFEAGADDYLGKPFDPRELVLRLRAMLRRAPPTPAGPAARLRLGPLEFDRDRAELLGPEGPIHLTGGESGLLAALAARPAEVLSREDIAAALGMDETSERAIDVQVTRLRRKIEADPREPRFLHTVRGRGYVLKPGA